VPACTRSVGRTDGERERARLGQLAVLPGPAAAEAAAHSALTQTGVHNVGVGRVDGEALCAGAPPVAAEDGLLLFFHEREGDDRYTTKVALLDDETGWVKSLLPA
jgi:hypothetical protein